MMNGLYIHVPFCQKRCFYCDFYSTTCGEEEKRLFTKAVCREIVCRADYLPERTLQSVYFGGGTPSQLSPLDLEQIFSTIYSTFHVNPNAEITIEVNPDDVSVDFASALRQLPVNRISMGVQSFDDRLLHLLNRRHTAQEAREAITRFLVNDITNLSIDLMYGLPEQTLGDWLRDLDDALSLPVKHLSAYALIYEVGTCLYSMKQNGLVKEVDEDLSLQMYKVLIDKAANAGMEHYEISNFAKPHWRAQHNSGYWHEMHYLGCGPGAHSYDGDTRQYDLSDLKRYLSVQGDVVNNGLYENEMLSEETKRNEVIMKSLRTSEGIDLNNFSERFGQQHTNQLLCQAKKYVDTNLLEINKEQEMLKLTRKGVFISDGIMSDLMEIK